MKRDMHGRHVSERQPERCPECGSEHIVQLIYGIPTEESIKLAEEGRARLLGCVTMGSEPSWMCRDCGAKIYKDGEAEETWDLF